MYICDVYTSGVISYARGRCDAMGFVWTWISVRSLLVQEGEDVCEAAVLVPSFLLCFVLRFGSRCFIIQYAQYGTIKSTQYNTRRNRRYSRDMIGHKVFGWSDGSL